MRIGLTEHHFCDFCGHEGATTFSSEYKDVDICIHCIMGLFFNNAEKIQEIWQYAHGYKIEITEQAIFARVSIPEKLRKEVYERDGYKCVSCKKDSDLSVDHIRPVYRGGITELSNLRTLCKSCNSKKGTSMPGVTLPGE